MIREALLHLPGIGPERLKRLHEAGIHSWDDILAPREETPLGPVTWSTLREYAALCEQAAQAEDIPFLVRALAPRDHWRILASYFCRASFFDIETSGLSHDSDITLIACYHRGRLHTFFKGENLDAFLELLEDIELLVSFNGQSFDVPRVIRAFNIPTLPCPHIDLRWLCYHTELTGGLKSIERRLGLQRPPDLQDIDGAEAEWLWYGWEKEGDAEQRRLLERYCCADVLSLQLVAAEVLRKHGVETASVDCAKLWQLLDAAVMEPQPDPDTAQPAQQEPLSPMEARLRRHRRRRG